MNIHIKMLVIAFLMGFSVQAQTETYKLTVPLTDPQKPYSLDVGLVNGSIKVVGYEGKDILIEAAAKSPSKNKNETKDGMKRIDNDGGIELNAEEKNNKVNIDTPGWMRAMNLSIKIPSNASKIHLHTVNNGDIQVENVKSEMEIKNVNGKITMLNVGGSVVANTINGSVVVNLNSVQANAPMAFSTLNGNVDITFPPTFKGNMKLKSDQGDIFTDFDMAIEKSSSAETSKSSKPRMYKIEVDNWVNGKINGGGPEVLMKNMHGNILIRKGK
jgi:hypothetical protein